MIRRLLSNQPSTPLNDQRENIFHTRYDVLKNTCFSIIDSGSCCNYCSKRLVEKLNLALIPHPKPYKLHWLNEDGDIKVKHQVDIKFSIGKYKDRVICDVIPMEAVTFSWESRDNLTAKPPIMVIPMRSSSFIKKKSLCFTLSILVKLLVIKLK